MAENSAVQLDAEPPRMSQAELDDVAASHARFMAGRPGGRRASFRRRSLADLSLEGRDLRQADFGGCVMTNMNLVGTNFREASLYACDLSDSNISRASFFRADLRGAVIHNAILTGADLQAADLRFGGYALESGIGGGRNTTFRGADLSDARMIGVLAQHADFTDAVLARVNFAGADMRGAIFEGADLTEAEVRGAQLLGANMRAANLTGVRMEDIRLQGIDIEGAVTDATAGRPITEILAALPGQLRMHRLWVSSGGRDGKRLDLAGYDIRAMTTMTGEMLTALVARDARWNGMNLRGVQLQNAQLERSDFSNADLRDADLRASDASQARFAHADLRGVNFGPLTFEVGGEKKVSICTLDRASLRYANCVGTRFRQASLRGADLSYADLTGADFRQADLRGARLDGAKMRGVMLEGALFDGEIDV